MPEPLRDQLARRAAALAPVTPPLSDPAAPLRRPRYTPELREIIRSFGSNPDFSTSLAPVGLSSTPALRDLYPPGSSIAPSPGFCEGLSPFQSLDCGSNYSHPQQGNLATHEVDEKSTRDARRARQVAAMSNLFFPSILDCQQLSEQTDVQDECANQYLNARECSPVNTFETLGQSAVSEFGGCSATSSPEMQPSAKYGSSIASENDASERIGRSTSPDQYLDVGSPQLTVPKCNKFIQQCSSVGAFVDTIASAELPQAVSLPFTKLSPSPLEMSIVNSSGLADDMTDSEKDIDLDDSEDEDISSRSRHTACDELSRANLSRVLRSSKKRRQLAVDRAGCSADQAKLNRAAALQRLRAKKNKRNFDYKIRYACRKRIALVRPRINGRFATKEEVAEAKRLGIPLR